MRMNSTKQKKNPVSIHTSVKNKIGFILRQGFLPYCQNAYGSGREEQLVPFLLKEKGSLYLSFNLMRVDVRIKHQTTVAAEKVWRIGDMCFGFFDNGIKGNKIEGYYCLC